MICVRKQNGQDGMSITPEDVIFSLNILKEKGSPIYRYYYANIKDAVKISDRTVRFEFDKSGNRELPLITGQLTILPEHYWKDKKFDKAILEAPLGSGPYKIKDFTVNRTITFERRDDYWAENLLLIRGSIILIILSLKCFVIAPFNLKHLNQGIMITVLNLVQKTGQRL